MLGCSAATYIADAESGDRSRSVEIATRSFVLTVLPCLAPRQISCCLRVAYTCPPAPPGARQRCRELPLPWETAGAHWHISHTTASLSRDILDLPASLRKPCCQAGCKLLAPPTWYRDIS